MSQPPIARQGFLRSGPAGIPLSSVRACAAMLAVVLALLGCGAQVEVVGALPETEANEVLSALLNAGIDARKSSAKTGVAVNVSHGDVARAIDVLRERGLPKERRSRMGDVFKKENLISSPLEERARYLYALSQELEQTLSQIDGVVTARVHVVLPERINPGEPTISSTASVFLKHQSGFGVDKIVPEVRALVASSIPGLILDKVTVSLVPAMSNADSPFLHLENVFFLRVEKGSAASLRILLGTLTGCLSVALLAVAYLLLSRSVNVSGAAPKPGLERLTALFRKYTQRNPAP